MECVLVLVLVPDGNIFPSRFIKLELRNDWSPPPPPLHWSVCCQNSVNLTEKLFHRLWWSNLIIRSIKQLFDHIVKNTPVIRMQSAQMILTLHTDILISAVSSCVFAAGALLLFLLCGLQRSFVSAASAVTSLSVDRLHNTVVLFAFLCRLLLRLFPGLFSSGEAKLWDAVQTNGWKSCRAAFSLLTKPSSVIMLNHV